MKIKYKIGDWVVRLNTDHLGIKVGQVCQIYDFHSLFNNQPKLRGQTSSSGSHDPSNLKPALFNEIPKTITKQQKEQLIKTIKEI